MNGGGLLVLALLLALFWFFLMRPQRRRQVEQERMLAGLQVGDEVVTAGGMYGDVVALDGDEVRLEIAPGTEVRVARRAITAVFEEDEAEGEDDMEDARDGDDGLEDAIDDVPPDDPTLPAERSAPSRES